MHNVILEINLITFAQRISIYDGNRNETNLRLQ